MQILNSDCVYGSVYVCKVSVNQWSIDRRLKLKHLLCEVVTLIGDNC